MTNQTITTELLRLLLADGALDGSGRISRSQAPPSNAFAPAPSDSHPLLTRSGLGQDHPQLSVTQTASGLAGSLQLLSVPLLRAGISNFNQDASAAATGFSNQFNADYAGPVSALLRALCERSIQDQIRLQQALQDGLDCVGSQTMNESIARQLLPMLLLEREAGEYDPTPQQPTPGVCDFCPPPTKAMALLRREGKREEQDKKAAKERPKRAMSAYNIFFKEERKRILAAIPSAKSSQDRPQKPLKKGRNRPHGKITFEELARKVSERWNRLSSLEYKLYQAKARADKKRHSREMEEFNKYDARANEERQDHMETEEFH